ncbi:MAG: VanW family protein [Candidatus Daviesbacteria bacterium]|nr:MAG: VanW family protein [Candidatus Daviesbacteria bacterium]
MKFKLAAALAGLLIITYEVIFADKFYPRTFVGEVEITGRTVPQVQQLLSEHLESRLNNKLDFVYQNKTYSVDLAKAAVSLNSQQLMEEISPLGHQGSFWQRLSFQLLNLVQPTKYQPQLSLSIDDQVNLIGGQIYQAPIQIQLNLNDANQIEIKAGQDGLSLDREQLIFQITRYLISGNYDNNLPVKTLPPDLSTRKAEQLKNLLENLKENPLILTFEKLTWKLDQKTIFSLLDLSSSEDLLNPDKLKIYLSNEVAKKIDQPVIEALFSFDVQSRRVTAFKPAQNGQLLDQKQTGQLIVLALQNIRPHTISLPVTITTPKITTSDVNDLGIKQLIGQGVSHFGGSIPNRIYNVNLTANKLNGALIPPGQIFSFNQTVGDITAATGFKQAYVIKEGRTVLDDGGGVCQDSTTLFRAVLNAGLPVIKRTAHAYRVGYYEQGFPPGLDATVFYPSVDFQFKNDTPGYILIQAYTQGLTLYVDLYGSSDGRIASLSTPVITNQTPPPPELRQDDHTLPKGTVKQVDWSAWGATVTFGRTVTRNGVIIINETWKSNYKTWQAVYLVGTQ